MFLVPDDLTAFADIDPAKAALMIEDAEAMAALAAPCLSTPEFQSDEARVAAVRAILRGALIRWHEAGSGVVTQQSAGPFAQTLDTRQQRRGMFWPSEIAQLRDICSALSGASSGKAYTVDTMPQRSVVHADDCNVVFGAHWCSCEARINRYESPLYCHDGILRTPAQP